VVAVLDDDLIPEEFSRACAGVGDQCFLLRQFQFEIFTQELREVLFDLLGFGLSLDPPMRFWGWSARLRRADQRVSGMG
jgi:hypothetical protein